jgi:hypothetical protein
LLTEKMGSPEEAEEHLPAACKRYWSYWCFVIRFVW